MNSSVDSQAFKPPYLHLVTPDDHDLHAQLISEQKIDKVHPIHGLNDLINNRLGYENFSKRCFALLNEGAEGTRDILAAIYTYWSSPSDHEEAWKMLPGKVSDILREPSKPLNGPATVVTFYSISSFGSGSGKQLISQLHGTFSDVSNPPILTTLSPLRTFSQWVQETGQEIEDTVESLKRTAARYLGLKLDPTQKFHMGNGAYLGAIHPYANEEGTADAEKGLGVMVSYRYPRKAEAMQANRDDYKAGAIPASGHLRSLLNRDLT